MNKGILNMVFAGCLVISACGKKQAPQNNEVPVNLLTVKSEKVLFYDKYPSTTAALMQVNILPQVQGYVTGIYFTEGSHVTKGQKLYDIDKKIYQDSYDAAEANLKVAQGTLTQSKQDADRYDYLNKYNAVAKQLYDHAVITLQNSQNSVKAAAQTVKTAKTNLGYSTIYAPFTGTIGFSNVKLGDVVSINTTIMNTVSTDDPMAVDFIVNEKQLPHFEQMKKNNHPLDSLFTILLPDNSTYPYVGKISIIDRAVDAQTGSIRIRLVFPNPKGDLKVGMSCLVKVHNQDTAPQMVIPNKAVVEQMGEYFVYMARDTMVNNPAAKADSAKDKKKELIAVEKKVQIGQVIGGNIVIKSGINDGDRVITDGVQTLHDGAPITTKNVAPPSAGGKKGK